MKHLIHLIALCDRFCKLVNFIDFLLVFLHFEQLILIAFEVKVFVQLVEYLVRLPHNHCELLRFLQGVNLVELLLKLQNLVRSQQLLLHNLLLPCQVIFSHNLIVCSDRYHCGLLLLSYQCLVLFNYTFQALDFVLNV